MHNTSRRIEATVPQSADTFATHFESSIIPTSFTLGGLTIDVVLDDTLVKSKNMLGEASYSKQMIRLDASAAPRQTVEQAFIHELTHWIFYVMNEDELRNNEKLVDLFSHFLYQALVTAKFEPAASPEVPSSEVF